MSLLKVSLFFLSSIIFFLIADFVYIDWFVIDPSIIDPWVYWGTGEVFEYVKFHFSNTYYFRRWTINFVNYLFSNNFDAYFGIYLKNSILLIINFFISTLLIYRLTKSFFLSATFLIFFIPVKFYFYSIGSNYNQATGIFFINLILLSTFIFSEKHKYKYFLFLGFVIFLTLVTYQFLLYVIFAIIFFWIIVNHKFFFLLNTKKTFLIILCIFIGLFAGILLEYFISWLLNVKWSNFFIYSIQTSFSILKSGDYKAPKDFYYSIFNKYRFIIPSVFISLTLLRISIFNKNKNYLAFAILMLSLTAVHLLDPFLLTNTTFFIQTKIYLFCFCLFGLILLLDFIIKDYRFLFKIFFVILFFLASLIILKYLNDNLILYTNVFILIIFFLILFFFNYKIINFFLIIFFISLYTQLINLSDGIIDRNYAYYKNRNDFKNHINKLSSEIKHATKQAIDFDPSQPKRLWILDNRLHEGWSKTITSLYGNYSAINLGYRNNAIECKQIDWILIFPNSVLVTYGFDTETDSLNKLIDLFKPCGSFVFEKSIKIENTHTFTVKKNN